MIYDYIMSDGDRELELSGLRTESGHVGRSLAGETYWIPQAVSVSRSHLSWHEEVVDPRYMPRLVSAPSGLLDRFTALRNAPDDRVRRFAEAHGVLNLCQHGLPRDHVSDQHCEVVGRLLRGEGGPRRRWPGEPVARWREIAAEFRTAEVIGARLHLDSPISPEEWQAVGWRVPPKPASDRATWLDLPTSPEGSGPREVGRVPASRAELRAAEWLYLTKYVNKWLTWAGVRPKVSWTAMDGTVWRNGVRDLTGALALQLAAAVSRAAPPRSCKACGEWFAVADASRGRPPRYCETCRRGSARVGLAVRAFRRRVRDSGPGPTTSRLRAKKRAGRTTR